VVVRSNRHGIAVLGGTLVQEEGLRGWSKHGLTITLL
jgi:hypothetical protein